MKQRQWINADEIHITKVNIIRGLFRRCQRGHPAVMCRCWTFEVWIRNFSFRQHIRPFRSGQRTCPCRTKWRCSRCLTSHHSPTGLHICYRRRTGSIPFHGAYLPCTLLRSKICLCRSTSLGHDVGRSSSRQSSGSRVGLSRCRFPYRYAYRWQMRPCRSMSCHRFPSRRELLRHLHACRPSRSRCRCFHLGRS